MKVHQTQGTAELINLANTKTATSNKSSNTFAALMSSIAPKAALNAILTPAKPVIGTASSTTTTPATTTSTPNTPFSASYIQGATVMSPDGTTESLNPNELASAPTAQQVAGLLGGTVVTDTMSGGYNASAADLEISVPGSSVEINAGLAANLFSSYGTAAGSQAWRIIDENLGIAGS